MKESAQVDRSLFEVMVQSFSILKEPRKNKMLTYPLEEVLFLVYCSSVCGINSYEEIEDFGEDRQDWLRKYLPYENGIPSHDTINRVMGLLDTHELERMLVAISSYELTLTNGTVVHIDGKWLGKSATANQQQTNKSEGGKQATIMVNAFSAAHRSCLASLEVGSKSGEKQAVEGILELLELSGCILTMDAGYCYKDVAEQVRKKGADYLIGLKKNQPSLFNFASRQFESGRSSSSSETFDKGHSREERRRCRVLEIKDIPEVSIEDTTMLEKWEGLTSLVQVESWVKDKTKGKEHHEQRFYICSLGIEAKKAAEMVRGHWSIENKLHWMLDVTMGEDDSTKRSANSAANYSIFRKMGLNKLQNWDAEKSKRISIKRKQNKCMANTKNLEQVLGFY